MHFVLQVLFDPLANDGIRHLHRSQVAQAVDRSFRHNSKAFTFMHDRDRFSGLRLRHKRKQLPPKLADTDVHVHIVHEEMMRCTAKLFDAYNDCDLNTLGSMVSDDLEFYHEQTALSVGKAPFRAAIKENIAERCRLLVKSLMLAIDNGLMLLDEIVSLEKELHRIETRRNRARMEMLLHPDFVEFGRSGQRYSRADILDEFGPTSTFPMVCSRNFEIADLGVGVVLLTYVSAHEDADGKQSRHTLRSSLWVRTEMGWQIRFHHGTPMDSFELRPPKCPREST